MRIFLLGFMGSGKSSIGKSLAGKLHYSFFDLDTYIQDMTGKTIADIFIEKGETAFRKLERKALKEIIKTDNIVVSCGGGTPCFFDNISMMNKKGLTVYMKYPIGKLKSRLLPNMGKRPLLKNIDSPEDLESFIRKKLEEREIFYLEAKLVLNNPAKSSDIFTAVIDFLKK
jgi:shikimate kinase